MIPGVVFTAFLVVIFAYGVYEAREFPLLARIFPYWISLVALILVVAQLVIEIQKSLLRAGEVHEEFMDLAPGRDIPPNVVYRRALRYLTWILGLYGAIWLVGFVIAMSGFLITFLRFEAKLGWAAVLLLTFSGTLFLVAISWVMTLFWPEGLISSWLNLPWPLT